MLRRMLLAASGSDRARRLITSAPYTRGIVARYVAGDDAVEAVQVAQRLLASGLLVSLDYLGEDTADPEQAAAVADEYTRLIGRLAAAGLAAGGRAEVSVKPTAVGLGLAEHGDKTAAENISRICVAARVAGTTVTLDMEDHTQRRADVAARRGTARGVPRPRLRDPVRVAAERVRLRGAGPPRLAGAHLQGRLPRARERCLPRPA